MNSVTDFVFSNLASVWSLITSYWLLSQFILVILIGLVVNLVRQTIHKE